MNELPAVILAIIVLASIGLALAALIMPIVALIISGRLYRCMRTLESIERSIRFYK